MAKSLGEENAPNELKRSTAHKCQDATYKMLDTMCSYTNEII